MNYPLLVLAGILASTQPVLAAAPAKRAHFETAEVPEQEIVDLKAEVFTIPNSHLINMVKIPEGSFTMGSPEEEVGRQADEKQHKVTISKPFYMGRTEISQQQYLGLMHPDFKPIFLGIGPWGHDLPELHQGGSWNAKGKNAIHSKSPMESVSWMQAVKFCKKLTEIEGKAGRLPKGYHYRLPTEAEWEYACRAGTTTPFNSEANKAAAYKNTGKMPKPSKTVYDRTTKNAFGLFHMHRGVFEWVLDHYGPYPADATDPVMFREGTTQKVARGGDDMHAVDPVTLKTTLKNEADIIRYVRSASRAHFHPGIPYPIVGFRPVLAPIIEAPIPQIPENQLIEPLK